MYNVKEFTDRQLNDSILFTDELMSSMPDCEMNELIWKFNDALWDELHEREAERKRLQQKRLDFLWERQEKAHRLELESVGTEKWWGLHMDWVSKLNSYHHASDRYNMKSQFVGRALYPDKARPVYCAQCGKQIEGANTANLENVFRGYDMRKFCSSKCRSTAWKQSSLRNYLHGIGS